MWGAGGRSARGHKHPEEFVSLQIALRDLSQVSQDPTENKEDVKENKQFRPFHLACSFSFAMALEGPGNTRISEIAPGSILQ